MRIGSDARAAAAALCLGFLVSCAADSAVRPPRDRMRGVSFAHTVRGEAGYGSESSRASLTAVRELDAEWVSIMPFGFQSSPHDPEIRWTGNGGRGIDETDERVLEVMRDAKARGLSVMLKPHLWLRRPDWPGAIAFADEAQRGLWFESYTAFILHYARLAATADAEVLCIGNELEGMAVHDREWREVISAVRRVYRGRLTWGANFTGVDAVPFWDAVDFIGVSAYYPLAEGSASMDELVRGWETPVRALSALSARTGKPVVFTEIGYRSAEGAAWKQWEIPRDAPPDAALQERAYRAFFQAVWDQPWFAGAFVWKWESDDGHRDGRDNDYHVRGKAAEETIRQGWRPGDPP